MAILETRDLTKYYGDDKLIQVKALDGVNLQIDERRFVSIVGSSGSGKSTLLHMIGGLDRPTSGEVFVRNKSLYVMRNDELTLFRRGNIGFVFQNFNLVPMLNVYQNIVLTVELDGKDIDKEYIDEIIADLGITDKINNMPNQLSGGQQQRVAIARALAARPAIILADEPTGSLDSKNRKDVMDLFIRTSKKYSQTVVVITHDESLAQMTDQIIRIEDGKIEK